MGDYYYIDTNGREHDCIVLEMPRLTAKGTPVPGAVAYIEVPALTEELRKTRARAHDAQVFRTYARWSPKNPRERRGSVFAKPTDEPADVVAHVEAKAKKKAFAKKKATKADG